MIPGFTKRRTMPGGRVDPKELPQGPTGRHLCRWCALEVPPRRSTFCSEYCVHEWKLRSDPGYLRDHVLRRDKGICAICRVDTVAAWIHIKKTKHDRRGRLLQAWGLTQLTRRSLWDADHILPVVMGGGECDLSNLRTLCLRCHKKATAELREKLKGQTG